MTLPRPQLSVAASSFSISAIHQAWLAALLATGDLALVFGAALAGAAFSDPPAWTVLLAGACAAAGLAAAGQPRRMHPAIGAVAVLAAAALRLGLAWLLDRYRAAVAERLLLVPDAFREGQAAGARFALAPAIGRTI